MSLVRTHVILPKDLVEVIDKLVGKRKRSQFLAEAAFEKLRHQDLLQALNETAGVVKEKDHPEWATSQNVAEWVERIRKEDAERYG